jgi:hypothetical protein
VEDDFRCALASIAPKIKKLAEGKQAQFPIERGFPGEFSTLLHL